MITITETTKKSIYAKCVYDLRYDKETKEISCTCHAGSMNRKCHHVKEFKEAIKDEK